ncbi:hypothetical protein [Nonomuraea diastatica]|uniref:hypothetical protein n=1 Tax=Nonomuraea diastatica TaxID=1848329 RepID=UPI00140C2CFD|nr:hypothetical protein [Nonomuraea diastatica]
MGLSKVEIDRITAHYNQPGPVITDAPNGVADIAHQLAKLIITRRGVRCDLAEAWEML